MPNTINADNGVSSGITGIRTTADNTGNLALQSNGVTVLTLATNNTATFANNVTVTGTLTTASQGIAFASLPTGSVLQVVQALLTTATSTSSTSFVTTGLTGTITPKFSTSKILVMLSAEMRSDANKWMQTQLFKNGSALVSISTGLHYVSGSTITTVLSYSYLDNPATTSATTYALYFNAQGGGTVACNIDTGAATIILMEIAG